MRSVLLLVLIMTLPSVDVPSPIVLPLRPGQTPGAAADQEIRDAEGRVHQVSSPTLLAWMPASRPADGAAIIVCSGGGYTLLAVERHGQAAAEALLPAGISVFSLKYRLAPPSQQPRLDAVADGRRAIRLVRSRAAEWGLDPRRVGMVGYSAGANLILNMIATPEPVIADGDAIDRLDGKPSFAGLFGLWPHDQKPGDFSFATGDPPLFIGGCQDDAVAPIAFSRAIGAAAQGAAIAVQLESFSKGGHLAYHLGSGAHGDWPQRFIPWLRQQGVLR